MAGLNVCLYIIGLIYIAMNIFLIINLKKFAEKQNQILWGKNTPRKNWPIFLIKKKILFLFQ